MAPDIFAKASSGVIVAGVSEKSVMMTLILTFPVEGTRLGLRGNPSATCSSVPVGSLQTVSEARLSVLPVAHDASFGVVLEPQVEFAYFFPHDAPSVIIRMVKKIRMLNRLSE